MKKYILLIFSATALSITISAQSIKGSLNAPTVQRFGDGVLVYGMTNDRVFKMLLYDKELKLKKEFSKSLSKDVSKNGRFVQMKDGNFEFVFCNNMFCKYGSVLKVNQQLEEVSYREYSKAEKDEFSKVVAPYGADATNKALGRRSFTDDDSYVTNTISGAHFDWGPRAGVKDEIYNTALQIPGSNEKVLIHKTYFDSIAHVTIAAGNYFEFKEKQKERVMKGLAVFFIDDKNSIIQIKKFEFPEYSLKEPNGYDFKDKQEFVYYITRTKRGTYVLNCTNAAKKSTGGGTPVRGAVVPQQTQGWDFYATIGFSYLELDSGLNKISSIFYPFEKIKDYMMATYVASANEGKTLIFSNAKTPDREGPVSSETLSFTNSPKPLLKTILTYDDTYFLTETRNAPVPNQFMMDNNTLIVFLNKQGKDDYELKLIKF